ncbi:MAG TPA: C-type lectin domain-containing protein, partial [Planctomycetaceae bacterium]|nr:C-type lectin domain-containing protein [Planctomycetaceae bacterium]
MRRSLLAILSLLLIAADPLEGDKFLEKADEKFEQAVDRTQQAFAKSMKEAYETRLKTYRSILAAATKAGDFDRATAVKAKIEEIEAERDEIGEAPAGKKKATKIPRDALAFGGHHYLIVDEQRTWHVAKRRCEEMGGHLATINTPEEE